MDARDFNNIETPAVITFFSSVQGKAPKEIHAILTETLACFLPGRAKDLSVPLFSSGLSFRVPLCVGSKCMKFRVRRSKDGLGVRMCLCTTVRVVRKS